MVYDNCNKSSALFKNTYYFMCKELRFKPYSKDVTELKILGNCQTCEALGAPQACS